MAFPTSIDVACTQGGCSAVGAVRRVQLRLVAVGVVDMPQLRCAVCGFDMYRQPDESQHGEQAAPTATSPPRAGRAKTRTVT